MRPGAVLRRLHAPVLRAEARTLERFTRWFDSQGGVYQTFFITVGLVVFEALFPNVDQHGFWLLYWLTVYSAITQPALAHAGKVAMLALQRFINGAVNMLAGLIDKNHQQVMTRMRKLERQNTEILKQLKQLNGGSQ